MKHNLVAGLRAAVFITAITGLAVGIGAQQDCLAQPAPAAPAPAAGPPGAIQGTLTLPKPLDLVWDATDPNGLPLNPKWAYRVTHPAPDTSLPDVTRLCGVPHTFT